MDLIFPNMNIIANTKTIIINKIDIEGYAGDSSPEIKIEKQKITQKWKIATSPVRFSQLSDLRNTC